MDPLGTIEDKNALADSKVNITCPKPSGNPEPSISWKMDGNKDLPSDQRYKKSGWSLIISNAKGSDSHNFTCIVKNIVKTLSTTMTLTVTGKPFLSGQLKSFSSFLSFPASLQLIEAEHNERGERQFPCRR